MEKIQQDEYLKGFHPSPSCTSTENSNPSSGSELRRKWTQFLFRNPGKQSGDEVVPMLEDKAFPFRPTKIRGLLTRNNGLDSKSNLDTNWARLRSFRSIDEFEKLNKIGEGTYGIVYRAKDTKTGEIEALKRIKIENGTLDFPFTREIDCLLSCCHHPSIVELKDIAVGLNLDTVFLVMEFVENDLKSLMETMKQPFCESEVRILMSQLLRGVKYLHDNQILHRDLKPSNLLLSDRGELKICDFGLSCKFGSPPYTAPVVTLWYRAPELLLGAKDYSTAIDMWSLGCIMAELLAKKPLFSGRSELDQLNRIFETLGIPNEKQSFDKLRDKIPPVGFSGRPTLSKVGFESMKGLLTYDPKKRITAEAALGHEWFKEVSSVELREFFPTISAQQEANRHQGRIMRKCSGPWHHSATHLEVRYIYSACG